MTSFLLLALLMIAAATAWLTQPLWRPALAAARLASTRPSTRDAWRAWWPTAAIALFVLTLVGGGYAWLGSGEHVDVAPDAPAGKALATASNPAAATPAAPSSSDPLTQAETRIAAMVDRLAERLKSRPDDADGWHMLGRSYATLGKHGQAITAYETALRLKPDDATLLAELAYSAAITNRRVAAGHSSAELLQRALQLDPRNPKALALAGTLSLDRKDYQGAVQYWEQLARVEPPDSAFGKQVQLSIAQARELAGSQAALLPVAADTAPSLPGTTPGALPITGRSTSSDPRATVGGVVTLAPALLRRAAPDDTVFVYARAANGSRMPLAILKKQVRDLPLSFTLDDSLSMGPNARLSSASRVVVGARISKSGNAAAQSGDLQGQLPAVALGARDLKLEIREVVRTGR